MMEIYRHAKWKFLRMFSGSGIDVRRISKLADHLDCANPPFDMQEDYLDCETPCCIAGHAKLLFGMPHKSRWMSLEFLRIPKNDAMDIYLPDLGCLATEDNMEPPNPYKVATPKMAARLLWHYLEMGEVCWLTAMGLVQIPEDCVIDHDLADSVKKVEGNWRKGKCNGLPSIQDGVTAEELMKWMLDNDQMESDDPLEEMHAHEVRRAMQSLGWHVEREGKWFPKGIRD